MNSAQYHLPQQSQAFTGAAASMRPPIGVAGTSLDPAATVIPPQPYMHSNPSYSPSTPTRSAFDAAAHPPSPSSSGSSHRQSISPCFPQESPPWQRADIRPKPEAGLSDSARSDRLTMKQESEDEMPPTCDFVRKLYRLLEDKSLSHIICWGPEGDFFIIKDVNTFTTDILPRTFKHSNFASFVRQLNKYDFHKMKSGDDNQFGENSWLFHHRDFHAGGLDALEHIKRKVPGSRKANRSISPRSPAVPAVLETLQAQIVQMAQQQEDLTAHIQTMENEYVTVLDGMIGLQRNFAEQDGTMRRLLQYALQMQNAGVAS
ncbi:hypothetical protein NM688_g113 [Phlebia brevispora]|uniref:Uncharacterized protein n=1 Tax=Phlebia brevispora TaxID=194682 RepID=A0ACC1TF44_9APHY|nr:hypothetical protein NM688_g113 [Phlebia brevispora]